MYQTLSGGSWGKGFGERGEGKGEGITEEGKGGWGEDEKEGKDYRRVESERGKGEEEGKEERLHPSPLLLDHSLFTGASAQVGVPNLFLFHVLSLCLIL